MWYRCQLVKYVSDARVSLAAATGTRTADAVGHLVCVVSAVIIHTSIGIRSALFSMKAAEL